MKVWQAAVVGALFLGLGWLLWGRQPPPLPPPPAKPDTTFIDTSRVDTIKWIPPRLADSLKALRGAINAFLADSIPKPDSACVRLLAQAGVTLDSLKQALAIRPAVNLALSDSLGWVWPVKALWVGVSYATEGDSAHIRWVSRPWYSPLTPKSRFGALFGYGAGCGGFAGAQVRFDQSKALQIAKSEKGWQGGLVWYVK